MLFENDNSYLDMVMNIPGLDYLNNSHEQTKEDNNDSFYRGNMFDKEFVPYKNMTYIVPKVKNERQRDLLTLMKYNFMVIDYNLYLDVHPNDSLILSKYKNAAKKLEEKTKDFEKKYGPLCNTTADYNSFKWIESPWPWNKEDGKYV